MKSYSVYYKSKNGIQMLGNGYHSKTGESSVAKKAMTKLHKKTGQTKASLYIREHGENSVKVYEASSAKLKCPKVLLRGGNIVYIHRRSKSRYSKTINM